MRQSVLTVKTKHKCVIKARAALTWFTLEGLPNSSVSRYSLVFCASRNLWKVKHTGLVMQRDN